MVDIYLITNLTNDKQYVGKSSNGYQHRFNQHCSAYSHGIRTYISCAIHKYGKENFKVELIRQVKDDEWKYWESYYIKKYHTHYTEGGYNITYGGDSNPMDIPEIQQKHLDKCTSKEFREKQRQKSTGKLHTDETKKLCRQKTLENLEVCVAGFKKYNESRKVKIGMIEDGKIIKEFECASDACRFLGKSTKEAGNILKRCDKLTKKGKPAKFYGYSWTKL